MPHIALPGKQIADGHQRGLILRIVPQDLLILGDCLVDLALIQKLQGAFERFALVEGHLWFRVSRAHWALGKKRELR